MTGDRDAALVERTRHGDPSAFDALMERYEGKVYRLALGMMKNREDALDAVQDAFLSVFRKIDSFKGESAFSTWLYRIALNSVYMKLRSKSRHDKAIPLDDEESFDSATGHARGAIRDWSERADDALLRQELGGIIREAVAALPEEYRAIFTLRDVEELSNQEVAEILGLTVAATKTRLHRARMFLRNRLSRHLQGIPR
ncbi:MAG TPA: sigma-70 family RNA polymerase sigma factor [Candidatus Polarisedimenticolia bacterium]|nr:sigma-70 family RNA polymerase sigma factor [Candidatus Polarisedimenticolia bacterium]